MQTVNEIENVFFVFVFVFSCDFTSGPFRSLCEWCGLNLSQFILRKMNDIWMIQLSVLLCNFVICIYYNESFKCLALFFHINNNMYVVIAESNRCQLRAFASYNIIWDHALRSVLLLFIRFKFSCCSLPVNVFIGMFLSKITMWQYWKSCPTSNQFQWI